jgi:hypothetical protein
MTALPDDDLPVKNASEPNLSTSSVPGNSGIEVATAPARLMASADVDPTPKKTRTELALMIRYWPALVLVVGAIGACCPAGGVPVPAVKVMVGPIGWNGKLELDIVFS